MKTTKLAVLGMAVTGLLLLGLDGCSQQEDHGANASALAPAAQTSAAQPSVAAPAASQQQQPESTSAQQFPSPGAAVAAGAAGAALAAATGAKSAARSVAPQPKYAKVVSAQPIRSSGSAARQVCTNEVIERAPPKHHNYLGTGIGALVGGVLGNQIGHGGGRTLATVAGAAAGGFAGNRIQDSRHQDGPTTETVQHCRTVPAQAGKVVGYNVVYSYNGAQHEVRMSHNPGDFVEVKQGVSVVGAD